MRPVSDRLLATIRGSHGATSRVRVCAEFQTGTDPDGTVIDVLSGDVVLDGTADVRSTVDLITNGIGMWPRTSDDLLAPYGNELFVERGVRYGDGAIEWVSLGYFRIEEPDQDQVPDGPIRLAGKDRMAGIVEARLLAPLQFTADQTYGECVDALILDVYPTATIEWDDNAVRDEAIGRSVIIETDRYGGFVDLIASVAKVAWWDHRGVLTIKDLPATDVPVFSVDAGPTGVLVSMSRKLTREGVYNAVVATGEAPDEGEPARGVAIDNNPSSPTYFYGRFGQVPRYYSSPLLLDDAACAAAALTILNKATGLPYSVDFTAVPNPGLEPFDCIEIVYSERYGTEFHVVEALTIPLEVENPMTGATRQQTQDGGIV